MNNKARIFISYSRQDDAVANNIYNALKADGFQVFIDSEDILSLEEWRPRLAEMIRSADVVLCILSQASLLSDTCKWELEFASQLNKRVVPVALEDVGADLPPTIAHVNYIPLYGNVVFERQLEKAKFAFDADIEWIRDHTRFGELANRWVNKIGTELRGKDLRNAIDWLNRQPNNTPDPTPELKRFIAVSRRKARRNMGLNLIAVVSIVIAAGFIAVLQKQRASLELAKEQQRTARQARDLATRNPEEAIRMALGVWPAAASTQESGPMDALNAVSTAIANQRLRVHITSQKGPVLHAAFTPDQQYIVTAMNQQTVQLYDAVTGASFGKSLNTPGPATTFNFSPDEQRIAVASGKNVIVWDISSRVRTGTKIENNADVSAVTFTPDGKTIVTAAVDRALRFWNPDTGKETRPALQMDAAIVDVFFGGDKGSLLVVTGERVRIFDFPSGTEKREPIQHVGQITRADISPDGHSIVAAANNMVGVWKFETGLALLEPQPIYPKGTEIGSIALSPDSTRIVTVSTGKTVLVSSAANGNEVLEIRNSSSRFTQAAFSPDGNRIVTSSEAAAHVYEVALGLHRRLGQTSAHDSLIEASLASAVPYERSLMSHNREITATVPEDNVVALESTSSGRPISNRTLYHSGIVSSVAFSPDDRFLVTAADDGSVRIWDTQSSLLLFMLRHPGKPIDTSLSADFTDEGQHVVTWRETDDIRVWNVNLPGENLMQTACLVLPFKDGYRTIVPPTQNTGASTTLQIDECSDYSPQMPVYHE